MYFIASDHEPVIFCRSPAQRPSNDSCSHHPALPFKLPSSSLPVPLACARSRHPSTPSGRWLLRAGSCPGQCHLSGGRGRSIRPSPAPNSNPPLPASVLTPLPSYLTICIRWRRQTRRPCADAIGHTIAFLVSSQPSPPPPTSRRADGPLGCHGFDRKHSRKAPGTAAGPRTTLPLIFMCVSGVWADGSKPVVDSLDTHHVVIPA